MTEPTLKLYSHPFSSYCQKALIAFYENAIPFEFRVLGPDVSNGVQFAHLWPIGRFPLLTDGDRTVPEASIIIEYLDLHHRGPVRLLPEDAALALEVRQLDRIFDNYVMTPMQAIVGEALRPEDARDPHGVAQACATLDRAYAWLDDWMKGWEWAAAGQFSLADCAAAPALLYADWVHPIPQGMAELRAYRARLLARPSYARALDEARPYRHLFPLGAPTDRD